MFSPYDMNAISEFHRKQTANNFYSKNVCTINLLYSNQISMFKNSNKNLTCMQESHIRKKKHESLL